MVAWSRSHVLPGSMLEAVTRIEVSGGCTFFFMNVLYTPPICLSPWWQVPKSFLCFVYDTSVKVTLQGGHHGEKLEGPSTAERPQGGNRPVTQACLYLVCLFTKKNKVCGERFVPNLDIQGLLRTSLC